MLRAIYKHFFPSDARPAAVSAPAAAGGSFLTEKEERIQLAYREGLFSPFQRSLENNADQLSQKNFWELLEKIDKGVSISNSPKELDLLCLFAFLIEPFPSQAAKEAALEEYLFSFTEEEEKANFLLTLNRRLPACIAVAVLQHASLDVCQIGRAHV